jgi:peptidoglycan/LPS O-acetylase OafA/YrhL
VNVGRFLEAIGAFGLFVAAFRSSTFRAIVRTPVLVTVGAMCYSIYLLHFFVIDHVFNVINAHLAASSSFAVTLVEYGLIALPLVLIVATVYFVLLERPCMRPDWPLRLRATLARSDRRAAREATARP